jgi:class 3 adenylate cyclase
MELLKDLDPEDARRTIDPALKLMMDAVRRYDGYIVQSTGDGIFALFGAPLAHEDHPQRGAFAIAAADDERKRREKVAGKVAVLDRSLEDTLPYQFQLLGIEEGDDPLAPQGFHAGRESRRRRCQRNRAVARTRRAGPTGATSR